ncbi:MAG: tetracycline resistance MFS efflux pump [Paracoccus denitrificans]|nr:MAG: tetracycline resistance MFS efflux pump [Paracoccus denitrificans]PZO84658.1 MAG: tetracycline resistance MFS efflux pump [Paracoccus denitrificans]
MADRSSNCPHPAPPVKSGNAARIFVLLTVMLDATGMGIIFPVMPNLLEELTHRGLSGAAVWGGIIATSYAAMQFLFGPIVGNLSDSVGRRPVMLVALVVMALDYVLLALAPTIWWVIVGRIIGGIMAATHATATAYMADVSTPSQKARNFGLIGAAFGIGFVLGPILGSLMSMIDLRAPFWTAAILAAANAIFGYFVLPETVTDRTRRKFSWSRGNPLSSFAAIGNLRGIGPAMAAFALFSISAYTFPAIWSFYGKARFSWDPFMIGMSLALFGLSLAVVQGALVAPAIRRFGVWRTAILGFSLEIAAFVFYGLVTHSIWALVFIPFAAIAGLGAPALQQIMSNRAPPDRQGQLQGVLASVTAISTAISPLLMTWIFSIFTAPSAPVYLPGAPFILAAFMMLAAVVILWLSSPRWRAWRRHTAKQGRKANQSSSM